MGLFGTILGGLTGGLPGLLGGGNKKAITQAAAAQTGALQRAIDESTRQFDLTRSDYQPYTSAGAGAIGAMSDLTGINGGDKWQTALDALKASPFFQSLFKTGQEAVLQNGSATSGLRGGNEQRSLADFGADTFAKTIQQQLQSLGGIAGIGSGVTTNLGALGAENSQNVGNLMVGQGNAQAGAILGRQQVNNNMAAQLQKMLMMFMPGAGAPAF